MQSLGWSVGLWNNNNNKNNIYNQFYCKTEILFLISISHVNVLKQLLIIYCGIESTFEEKDIKLHTNLSSLYLL